MMYAASVTPENSISKAPAHLQLFAKGVPLLEGRGLALPVDRLEHTIARVKISPILTYVDVIQTTVAHVLETVEGVELYELRHTTHVRDGNGWALSGPVADEHAILFILGLDDVRDTALAEEAGRVRQSRQMFRSLFNGGAEETAIDKKDLS